uniref:Uncharacterized protein n=1 Tax=viral metagenome TaxID=1070528 RepID=A0A6M3J6Z6_9ZZZZ
MTMSIYSRPGARAVFVHPQGGYDSHIRAAAKYLTLGATYTVLRTDVGDYHTSVWLAEVPGVAFNSCLFDDVPSLKVQVA